MFCLLNCFSHYLLQISPAAVVLAISLTIVNGRSAPTPQAESKDQSNLILLDVPAPEGVKGSRLELEGDTLLVKGKQFSSVQELKNVLGQDRKSKSSQDLATSEPFSLVVPVARNFSSVKELFEILREDRSKPQRGFTGGARNQTYVRGSENSEVVLFFTS